MSLSLERFGGRMMRFGDEMGAIGPDVAEMFRRMEVEIGGTFRRIERDAAGLAVRLPRYFDGPLAEIARMFAAMAGSARASLNSVAASARAALVAVAAVNTASASVQPVAARGGVETVGLMAVSGPLEVSGRDALCLPEPSAYWGAGFGAGALPVTVAVTVQNENHIASAVDAEAVLREMEVRLADAVASSVEGVYA